METNKNPLETGSKQDKHPNDPKRRLDGTFLPGVSPNPTGRPAGAVDPVREIGLRIAKKNIGLGIPVKTRRKLEKLGLLEDPNVTLLESIMLELATSSNPAKLQMFLERTFGKVANVNVNNNINFDMAELVKKYSSKFTLAELERIATGENALEILLNKLPDIEDAYIPEYVSDEDTKEIDEEK